MITIGKNQSRKKAVPKTTTIIFQLLVAVGVGLAVLVAGVLQIIDLGRVTTGGVVMPLVGIFLLGVAIFVGRDLPAARKLDTHGEIAPGKIVAKWTKTDSDQDRKCYLAYKFGEEQEAFQTVSWKYYRLVDVETVVEVRYLPENPTLSRLEGEWYR